MKAEYIDHLGDDLRVVNAARVSFDKESDWEWSLGADLENNSRVLDMQPNLSSKDQKLLNYLAKHNHWTPFSHVMITMRETVPLFVRAQRMKHFVGFNLSGENDHEGLGMTYNEVSRRYVDDEPEFLFPETWRKRAENKKQGSEDEPVGDYELHEEVTRQYAKAIDVCEKAYESMIEWGVAPEQARMVLPQSMYTSYYVTGSLAAWARAYKLRNEETAQQEIQDLAHQWGDIIGGMGELKYSWQALTSN